jgi:cytochrome c-type biogenesis protein CcmF
MTGLLVEQVTARAAKTSETLPAALKQVVTGDGAFWGGQLSHVGVVLVAIGIAFAANMGSHTEVELSPGESAQFQGYTLTFESPFRQVQPSKTVLGARMTVTRDGNLIGLVEPSANFFGSDETGVSTPDVLHRPGGDLYITLLSTPETGSATFQFDTSPMIWVLWLGGLTTAAGGFLAMAARRRERSVTPDRQTVDV